MSQPLRVAIVDEASKKQICFECRPPRQFTRKASLLQHHNYHTGNRPYLCGVLGCNKAFPYASSRDRHERNESVHPWQTGAAMTPTNDHMMFEDPEDPAASFTTNHSDTPFGPSLNEAERLLEPTSEDGHRNMYSEPPAANSGPARHYHDEDGTYNITGVPNMHTVPAFGPELQMTTNSAQLHASQYIASQEIDQVHGVLPTSLPRSCPVRRATYHSKGHSWVTSDLSNLPEPGTPERLQLQR